MGKTTYLSESGKKYTADAAPILGSGAFGQVVPATRESDGLRVAIKINTKGDRKSVAFDQLEQRTLTLFQRTGGHENVIKLLDIVVEVGSPGNVKSSVLERMDCDLLHWKRDFMKQKGAYFSEKSSEAVKLDMARQFYAGLAFIHTNNITHFDIHTGNVLLDKRAGLVKICDFGNASLRYEVGNREWVTKHRLSDIRRGANLVVAPLWLNSMYDTYLYKAKTEFSGPHAAEALEYVFNFGKATDKVAANNNWWMTLTQDFKSTLMGISDFAMNRPSYGGVAVPQAVAEILNISLLYAPYNQLSPNVILEKFSALVSPAARQEAREFLRNA